MPRYAPNKMPAEIKRRYFELIRQGWSGASAAEQVGGSLSCGSLWFIDAGRVSFVQTPISRWCQIFCVSSGLPDLERTTLL